MSRNKVNDSVSSVILSAKLFGDFEPVSVGALVDSGCDCNLIDWQLAHQLGIKSTPLE